MKPTTTYQLTAAAAIAAAAAVTPTAPAYANPPLLHGTYTDNGGPDEFVWTISTTCTATGCAGTVTSNQGWTVPTTLTDGRWNFTVTKPDGAICTDGSYAPAYVFLSIDPLTLAGTISSDSNYGCPGGNIAQTPFQLHRIA